MRRSSGRPRSVTAGGWSYDPERAGLRVLAGRPLGWRHRLAGVAVVASDVDADSGVAAVWLVQRAGWPGAMEEICLFERVGDSWRYLGGGSGSAGMKLLLAGRPSASRAGPASMMTSLGGSSVRSRADREAQGFQRDLADVGWVASARFRVATEVANLQVGARRIKVLRHGYVIVAWKARLPSSPPPRPPIVAVGENGSRLTELGPNDQLDSLTWASLEGD
jgi:hypothetical protein